MTEHVDKISKSNFNRQRPPSSATSVYRGNCKAGYKFTTAEDTAAGQAQFHHILPVQSLSDGQIDKQDRLDYFHDCMAATKWDINDEPNLIALPTKRPYLSADKGYLDPTRAAMQSVLPDLRDLDAQEALFGTLPDLPCHQNAHNIYNEEVIKDLNSQLWNRLAAGQAKKKDCKDKVKPKDIKGQLDSLSSQWKFFLVGRGRENGGAAHCWRNRFEIDDWYVPFSMNPGTPAKAAPPPAAPSKGVKDWLENLFGGA